MEKHNVKFYGRINGEFKCKLGSVDLDQTAHDFIEMYKQSELALILGFDKGSPVLATVPSD